MPERLRIADSVGQLPRADWEGLVRDHPALRLEVLEAMATASDAGASLRIFMLEDDAGIAAAAVCERTSAAGKPSFFDSLLFGRAARSAGVLGVSTGPALLVRPPLGIEPAVVLRPAHPAEQRRALCSLLDGLEAHAATCGLGLAFIGVFDDEQLLLTVLRERRYLGTEIQPTARMKIEWPDFAGYLKHLRQRSKSAAQTARTERTRNRHSGVSIRQVPAGAAEAQALDAIARDHFRHKNGRELPFGPDVMPRLAATLGDDLLIFEAVRAGRRVGMLGVVRSGSVGWVAWIGMDARDRPNDFTYANLCFYYLTESAAALGLKTVHYGTSAIEAKLRRGCEIITTHLFYRPRSRVVRFVARPYLWIHRAWYRRKLR